MHRSLTFIAVGLILCTCLFTSLAIAQSAPGSASERKVSARIAPNYPELAKKMHLQGIVKIEAIVRPNGSVKSTRVLGGNPVLVEAAADAVNKWKFETASAETTEVVQVTFIPQ